MNTSDTQSIEQRVAGKSTPRAEALVWVRGRITSDRHHAVRVEMVRSRQNWDEVTDQALQLWLARSVQYL